MFCVCVLSECVIYVLVLCVCVCVCVCDTVHVFTQQEIGLLWGGFRTGESSYCIMSQKQLFHKAVYLMSLTAHC